MLENKNPEMKLFGRQIPLSSAEEASEEDDYGEETETDHDRSLEEPDETMQQDDDPVRKIQNPTKPEPCDGSENPKNPSIDEENPKGLKKPDKILPCPRCSSSDTKFCYYNNYNVNQPRHFCRSCQRYWTAGGTMRSVPVGAGKRKNNKSSGSHSYRHISISESLQATRDNPDSKSIDGKGTVPRFGVDSPVPDGIRSLERRNHDSLNNGFVPHCIPWPYSWNIPAVPGIYSPGFGVPYGAPMDFWNCTGLYGSWNIPWQFPNKEERIPSNGSDSRTLGKRVREETETRERNNGSVLVPKALRMNDPTEVAKSTIWATLGIENGCRGRFLKALESKGEDKSKILGNSTALRANPAALCRSIEFRESS